MEYKGINNGDIFDIGQTVNGISKFLWLNDKWYYFEERLSKEYEYDQEDLTNTVLNINDLEDIKHLGNIFKQQTNIEKLKVCFNDTIWMAIRYADGRHTYAPSMVRESIDKFKQIFKDWSLKEDSTIQKPKNKSSIMGLESDYLYDLFNKK